MTERPKEKDVIRPPVRGQMPSEAYIVLQSLGQSKGRSGDHDQDWKDK